MLMPTLASATRVASAQAGSRRSPQVTGYLSASSAVQVPGTGVSTRLDLHDGMCAVKTQPRSPWPPQFAGNASVARPMQTPRLSTRPDLHEGRAPAQASRLAVVSAVRGEARAVDLAARPTYSTSPDLHDAMCSKIVQERSC